MIDRALEQADHDDAQQVLSVLEQFAIECSIIKIWESEALGYVVDEEVQVFGGYGYSKDYPAERAFRDARIARIYEGTNEINRIVIGSQLLKRSAAGQLPLMEEAARVLEGENRASDTLSLTRANIEFSDELLMLKAAKSMSLAAIGAVVTAYGERARDEQEAIALIADIVMDVFAIESTLLRTQRLVMERGINGCAVQSEITRVFTRDAAARIERAALAAANETGDERCAKMISQLAHKAPIKPIAARRRIADASLEAGRYNL
jgi:hypothetical protein